MPFLPLDYPEPFAATLGVMLYPDDERKARALAAQHLAVPLERLHREGHRLPYDQLMRIVTGGGELLEDRDDRVWAATATGEQFKALRALYNTDKRLATWNNAIRIAEKVAGTEKGARSLQWKARQRFLSVAHLWAAWSIREWQFTAAPEVDYDYYDDFQFFLAEAEFLRDWGQTWRPPRANSKTLLPSDVWRVPPGWGPPKRKANWPETGRIPCLRIPDDLIDELRLPGRPRRSKT